MLFKVSALITIDRLIALNETSVAQVTDGKSIDGKVGINDKVIYIIKTYRESINIIKQRLITCLVPEMSVLRSYQRNAKGLAPR